MTSSTIRSALAATALALCSHAALAAAESNSFAAASQGATDELSLSSAKGSLMAVATASESSSALAVTDDLTSTLGGGHRGHHDRPWHGHTPPVPEPETWALMLAGLALLGRVARRGGRQG